MRQQLQCFRRLPFEMMHAGFDLFGDDFRQRDAFDPGDKEGITFQEIEDTETVLSLADNMVRSIRDGDIAQDRRHRADLV